MEETEATSTLVEGSPVLALACGHAVLVAGMGRLRSGPPHDSGSRGPAPRSARRRMRRRNSPSARQLVLADVRRRRGEGYVDVISPA